MTVLLKNRQGRNVLQNRVQTNEIQLENSIGRTLINQVN